MMNRRELLVAAAGLPLIGLLHTREPMADEAARKLHGELVRRGIHIDLETEWPPQYRYVLKHGSLVWVEAYGRTDYEAQGPYVACDTPRFQLDEAVPRLADKLTEPGWNAIRFFKGTPSAKGDPTRRSEGFYKGVRTILLAFDSVEGPEVTVLTANTLGL